VVTASTNNGKLSTTLPSDTPAIATALAAWGVTELLYDVKFTSVPVGFSFQNFAFPAPADSTPVDLNDPNLTRLKYGGTIPVFSLPNGVTPFGASLVGAVDMPTAQVLLGIPGVSALTGVLVGTTDAQALTHKDLTDPTNTFPATLERVANKNQPNGYAGLDGGGRLPAALWPSGVDKILEYSTLAAFPTTGAANIIYVALNSGTSSNPPRAYRWGGSAYWEIEPSPGSTDAVPEGITNLYYTNARADGRITNALTGLGTSLLRRSSGGGFAAAIPGTDYAPPTSGSSLLKGNGAGGFSSATSGADYAPATTGSSLLKANGAGGFTAASNTSDYVPWQAGTGGVLPATSGQYLTTQGGSTLDDGSGNATIAKNLTANSFLRGTTSTTTSGGTTTLTIASSQVQIFGGSANQTVVLPTTSVPAGHPYQIINNTSAGTITVQSSNGNTITTLAPNRSGLFTASWANPTASNQWNFDVRYWAGPVITGGTIDGVTIGATTAAPSVTTGYLVSNTTILTSAGHNAIVGQVTVDPSTVLTSDQGWVGSGGHVTGAPTGGTSTTQLGSFWGGWFTASITGGSYQHGLQGIEVDVNANGTNIIQHKIGIRINLGNNTGDDTLRAAQDDVGLNFSQNTGATGWAHGIKFGTDQSLLASEVTNAWPFTNTSTIIGTSAVGNGLPANIGIDFSKITFSDCAIKTGPAPIQMGAMASAPATPASGKGNIYMASDGSLHFIGPNGTDTRLAVA
jgi:hypothetical protein